jgi:hypothetical protein
MRGDEELIGGVVAARRLVRCAELPDKLCSQRWRGEAERARK